MTHFVWEYTESIFYPEFDERSFSIDNLARAEESSEYSQNHLPVQILPDTHGNFIAVIYYLAKKGSIRISQEDYAALLTISCSTYIDQMQEAYIRYQNIPEELEGPKNYVLNVYHFLREKVQQEIQTAEEIFNRLDVNPELVLNIGDEGGDRAYCDFFFLLLLGVLVQKSFKYASLHSNHGSELQLASDPKDFTLISAKAITNDHSSKLIMPAQVRSLTNFKILQEHGIVSREKCQSLLTLWINSLNVITYSCSEEGKKLFIYTHARMQPEAIRSLALKFSVEYDSSSCEGLKMTLDAINTCFRASLLQDKSLWQLLDEECRHVIKNRIKADVIPFIPELALYNVSWSRTKNPESRELRLPDETEVFWVNGHDTPPENPLSQSLEIDTHFAAPNEPSWTTYSFSGYRQVDSWDPSRFSEITFNSCYWWFNEKTVFYFGLSDRIKGEDTTNMYYPPCYFYGFLEPRDLRLDEIESIFFVEKTLEKRWFSLLSSLYHKNMIAEELLFYRVLNLSENRFNAAKINQIFHSFLMRQDSLSSKQALLTQLHRGSSQDKTFVEQLITILAAQLSRSAKDKFFDEPFLKRGSYAISLDEKNDCSSSVMHHIKEQLSCTTISYSQKAAQFKIVMFNDDLASSLGFVDESFVQEVVTKVEEKETSDKQQSSDSSTSPITSTLSAESESYLETKAIPSHFFVQRDSGKREEHQGYDAASCCRCS